MINHITFLNYFTCIFIEIRLVWIHYKNWIIILIDGPLNLWKHTSIQKTIINTYRSRPNSCSDFTCSLYQNKSCLIVIILPIFRTKFFTHINITFWRFFILFRMKNLKESILLYHYILALLDDLLCQKIILLFMFLEIKFSLQIWR